MLKCASAEYEHLHYDRSRFRKERSSFFVKKLRGLLMIDMKNTGYRLQLLVFARCFDLSGVGILL